MDYPYREVFEKLEQSLIKYGSAHRSADQIRSELDWYKNRARRELSDAEYYSILVYVTFYSGFRASTVSERCEAIDRWFGNYRVVADYEEKQIAEIMDDPGMIRHRRKIEACIANAKFIRDLVQQHGSFAQYIASFGSSVSFENLLLLKEELQGRFDHLGEITVYHFLTDISMPVLKPDRVIERIFRRLGLIEYEGQRLKTVIQGRKFADATGLPIRYIDIVFVAYGQMRTTEFGIDRGICLKHPRCEVCGISEYCHYSGVEQVAATG